MLNLLIYFLYLASLCLPILSFGKICFLHIPKTGGSTICALLENRHKQNEIYTHRDAGQLARNTYDAGVMASVLRAFPPMRQPLAMGHFPFWFFQNKDPSFQTSFLFTVLREPVDRVISSYFYRLANEKLESPLEVTSNRMCKMLCSDASLCGEALLQDCIRNLQRMDFIIFMDDFEKGVRRLFKKMGFEDLEEVPHCNRSQRSKISKEVIQEIEKVNELDVRLYKYASENLRHKSC